MIAFIYRRYWLFKNRIITTLAMMLLLPLILTVAMIPGMKNLVGQNVTGIPYEQWAFPGVMLYYAAVLIAPLIYRDFFDLRVHQKVLIPISLSPLKKPAIILGIQTSVLIEVLILVFAGMIVYDLLYPGSVTIFSGFIVLIYCILFSYVFSSFIILLSLLIDRISVLVSATITTLVAILFTGQMILDYSNFPEALVAIIQYLPFSMVTRGCRSVLSEGRFDFFNTFIPVLFTTGLIILDSYILKKRFKQ